MAQNNRIGPYIEYRADTNRDGLHRVVYDDLQPQDLFDIDRQLEKHLSRRDGLHRHSMRSEFQDVVFGQRRPLDEVLRNAWQYTDPEYWQAHHARWMPNYRHRLCVGAHITSHGNLSVTLSRNCLSPRGMWEPAGEWMVDPFWGFSGFMERPLNEALFLHDVSPLFRRGLNVHTADAATRSVHCRAVLASFWLTMDRLYPTFELHYASYIAGLTEKPVTWKNPDEPLVGLEIVDGLGEYRDWLKERLDRFQEDTGYSPESFYDECEESRRGLDFDRVSKRIRHSSRGLIDLVPSAVRDLYDFLQTVRAYGIWRPGTLRSDLKAEIRSWNEKHRIPPQVAVAVWGGLPNDMPLDLKIKVLRDQHDAVVDIAGEAFETDLRRVATIMARLGIDPVTPRAAVHQTTTPQTESPLMAKCAPSSPSRRRTVPAKPAECHDANNAPAAVTPGIPASKRTPPAYPTRVFEPGPDELADLGVAGVRELVDLMNERLVADRQFPITTGDYPTTKAKFNKIAKRWRAMRTED